MADFPLDELDIDESTLASLKGAGYSSFLDIIDLEEADFKAVSGIDEAQAARLLTLIDELTVVEAEPAATTEPAEAAKDEASKDEASEDEAAAEESATEEE